MDNEQLVKSIRKLCKNNDIAISQLENDLNFGAGLISRWNKNSPSIDKIVDIADYFHVSLDEVVGYKQDDVFLNMLCGLTNEKKIKWSPIDINTTETVAIPHKVFPYEYYDEEKYAEQSYFTKYKDGFIIIYAFHEHGKLINPNELSLYIQPSKDHQEYAWQDYSTHDLKSLWLDILSNMDEVPVEIKAEEMKNNFIREQSKFAIESYSEDQLKQITKNMIEMEPQLPKLFETINNPDFIRFFNMMQYPNLQQNLELAQKLSPYYEMIVDESKKTP